jgi:[ribosomal protein S5]-alanine N-acetyltransferase
MKVVETPRLILRYFKEDDLDQIASILADPDVMRFSLSGPKTREQTQEFLEAVFYSYEYRKRGLYAVIHKADTNLIGFCGLLDWEIDGQPEIEIGYRLDPAYWRQGLGTEAAIAVRDYGLNQLKLKRLIAVIQPENKASIRVAEKLGMRAEKEMDFKGLLVRVYALSNS